MQQNLYSPFVEGEGRITIGRVTSTSGPDFMSIHAMRKPPEQEVSDE